jgi:hypothetical protein
VFLLIGQNRPIDAALQRRPSRVLAVSGTSDRRQEKHVRQHEADDDQCQQTAGIALGRAKVWC